MIKKPVQVAGFILPSTAAYPRAYLRVIHLYRPLCYTNWNAFGGPVFCAPVSAPSLVPSPHSSHGDGCVRRSN